VIKDTVFRKKKTLLCRGKLIDLSTPLVMGILNVTPDSFYDGGELSDRDALLKQAEKMLKEGAAFLDLGAVSTRPGAKMVSEQEESDRLLRALISLTDEFPDAIISIDTCRSNIAKEAAKAGAAIINDISGGTADPEMMKTVADCGLPFIMMHMKGTPENMQSNPKYQNVTKEVIMFLSTQLHKAYQAGINDVIVDPGFGFGKTVEHNFSLLENLNAVSFLECPVLVGISRKSMINKVLGTKPESALNGTTSAHTIALLKGADILRVHDVKEAIQVINVTDALFKID
jgi:dihydropteroate synthase